MATVLQDLWPEDIKSAEVLTPEQILRVQGAYLRERTQGIVDGIVTRSVVEDRVIIDFDLASPQKRIRLLSAQHQLEFEYPASIMPPTFTLPNYLRESYYVEGPDHSIRGPAMAITSLGRSVRNEWVCGTPEEFVEKVGKILGRAEVKSIVLSLIAGVTRDPKKSA